LLVKPNWSLNGRFAKSSAVFTALAAQANATAVNAIFSIRISQPTSSPSIWIAAAGCLPRRRG
jgi:hypothetical protein